MRAYITCPFFNNLKDIVIPEKLVEQSNLIDEKITDLIKKFIDKKGI